MSLTELEIKAAKAGEKSYSLTDGRGLLLDVRPNGRKYWIARVWVREPGDAKAKEKRRGLGTWPEVSLKKARELCFTARSGSLNENELATFGAVAEEWLEKMMKPRLSAEYIRTIRLRLNKYILPPLKGMCLNEITPGMVLEICRRIEADGFLDTAGRIRAVISQVFDYAITTDRTTVNPASTISRALQPHKRTHYATVLGLKEIGHLMRQIEAYPQRVVRSLMQLSALTFCRPGEVRRAEWREFDIAGRLWTIPAEKMKMRTTHYVPLSEQALALISELKSFTGEERYLFPSVRGNGKPFCDGTVRMALRSMGYGQSDMTAHGFRAMASTVLNEYEWPADIIEAQLAHGEANAVRAAYNRAVYMTQRSVMMQWWSDYLDAAKTGTTVPAKPKVVISV